MTDPNAASDQVTAMRNIAVREPINSNDQRIPCRLHCRTTDIAVDLQAVSAAVANLKWPSILGGNPATAEAKRFSYWAAEPRDVFEVDVAGNDPLDELRKWLAKYELKDNVPVELPQALFTGGWIGYFSYDLGRHIETLPHTVVDDLQVPLIRLCFYDRMIAYDRHNDVFWLIVLGLPDDNESPGEKLAGLEHLLKAAKEVQVPAPPWTDMESAEASITHSNMTRENYLEAVKKVGRYIHDGDVYQVNFSQRFERPFAGRPIDLFQWQNHYNPSPYAAYIDAGMFQIVSASPELFISLRDGWIQTKPIKGTRRRFPEKEKQAQERNERNRYDLLTSSKEQAELNMIVDLERNDIARICRPGTRRVVQPRTIETCPTVFHAVATVGGQLRSDVDLVDILRAVFPGGSITGAPKIRAMEIIDELEPTARGIYTGSIGFIGLDGAACLNIAIRTVIIAAHRAFVQTGGGIVADSDPQAEWEETITKARALLAGIEAVQK